MTTATLTTETQTTTIRKPKETPLSPKATAWCRKVAGVAAKRIFRVKDLADQAGSVDTDSLEFLLLPKIFHRKRISHTDRQSKVYLLPEFFDEKGNIRKKLPKELRDELKAAIYKEVAHFVVKRPNADFYKIMVRCPWTGPRVDGARGSSTEARKELDTRRQKKLSSKRTVTEVPTGLTEDVKMWSLTEGKHVLVKDAQIFLANGKIKIARGEHNGKKLRTMLPGGAALKAKLNL
jgi:hypothetical protein